MSSRMSKRWPCGMYAIKKLVVIQTMFKSETYREQALTMEVPVQSLGRWGAHAVSKHTVIFCSEYQGRNTITSLSGIIADFIRAIRYSRRLIQREHAGIAKEDPRMILEAERSIMSFASKECNADVQISHHTGAQLITLPFHTTEFINWLRQAMAVHSM